MGKNAEQPTYDVTKVLGADHSEYLPADQALRALITGNRKMIENFTLKNAIPKRKPFSPREKLPGLGHSKQASAPICE